MCPCRRHLGVFGLWYSILWLLVSLSQSDILNIVILLMVSFNAYVFCLILRRWRQLRAPGRMKCSLMTLHWGTLREIEDALTLQSMEVRSGHGPGITVY